MKNLVWGALVLGASMITTPAMAQDCPAGKCPEGVAKPAAVDKTTTVANDDAEEKEIRELEKELNKVLLVDESGKIVLREEVKGMLPIPAERVEAMLGTFVELGENGKIKVKDIEMVRPYLPMIRRFLKQGGLDRMKNLTPERREAMKKMLPKAEAPTERPVRPKTKARPKAKARARKRARPERRERRVERRVERRLPKGLEQRLARIERSLARIERMMSQAHRDMGRRGERRHRSDRGHDRDDDRRWNRRDRNERRGWNRRGRRSRRGDRRMPDLRRMFERFGDRGGRDMPDLRRMMERFGGEDGRDLRRMFERFGGEDAPRDLRKMFERFRDEFAPRRGDRDDDDDDDDDRGARRPNVLERGNVFMRGFRRLMTMVDAKDRPLVHKAIKTMLQNTKPGQVPRPEQMMETFRKTMDEDQMARLMEIFSEFSATKEGKALQKELEAMTTDYEGFMGSEKGKQLTEALKRFQGGDMGKRVERMLGRRDRRSGRRPARRERGSKRDMAPRNPKAKLY